MSLTSDLEKQLGEYRIVRTGEVDGDHAFYVPLRRGANDPAKPPAAQVRHNPLFGTFRCDACRSRVCRHVQRLQRELHTVA